LPRIETTLKKIFDVELKCLVKSDSEAILSDQCWFYKEKNTNFFSSRNIIEKSTLDGKLLSSYNDQVEIASVSVCIVKKYKDKLRESTT
jgi:hypothetical protein